MKLYLSSYKLGERAREFKSMFPVENKTVGYIPNALDFSSADPVRRQKHIEKDMGELKELGLKPELLDLKMYFNNKLFLTEKISALGGVWISGGNVFVLRQAMRLSGLDQILLEMHNDDFVYGGYSAAGCVLSPSMKGYELVDDATDLPYEEQKEVLWDGLNIVPYALLPHYDSDHPESDDVGKELANCIEKKVMFIALRDGDAIISDSRTPHIIN